MLTLAKQRPTWEVEMREALRTAEDLASHGLITPAEIPAYRSLLGRYKFLLPQYYANLIDRNDPYCPIRLQAIPTLSEMEDPSGWSGDPLADLAHQPAERITHRYRNRLLLHLTPNCSMYCRFCFRKTLLNEKSPDLFSGALDIPLQYIRTHQEVEEVILSGGDPFLLSDSALGSALSQLEFIPHVKTVRIHTRVPVTLPSRVTSELCSLLKRRRYGVVLISHFNHPREVTPLAISAIQLLQNAGVSTFNQSVLLSGVNDNATTLCTLVQRLFSEASVVPYYLHHPDRAAGTSHFDISFERGLEIHCEMARRLPAYLLPRYVVDTGNVEGKTDVSRLPIFS